MKMISVIIDAHNQGKLLYRTIRSIYKNDFDYNIEVICCLDTPSSETVEYANIAKEKFTDLKIITANYNDVGLLRNKGVDEASGEYILFLDAGDIILPQTIDKLYVTAKKTNNAILVPLYSITFDSDRQIVEKHEECHEPQHAKTLLFLRNPWGNAFFLSKKTFLKNKYKGDDRKYNLDLYNRYFFEESIISGVKINVVPETVVFTRNSHVNSLLLEKSVVAPSRLFEKFEKPEGGIEGLIEKSTYSSTKTGIISRIMDLNDRRPFLKKLISNIFPNFYVQLFIQKEKLSKKFKRKIEKYPNWLVREWTNANNFDNLLFPIKFGLSDVWFKYNEYLVDFYDYFRSILPNSPDYLVICPWIKTGGADKLTLNLIRGISEISPDSSIALITTEPVKSEWTDNLPENIKILEYGVICKDLNQEEREILLLRLLLQLKVKRLVNVNSNLMYQLLIAYGRPLSKNSEIYSFCFSPSRNVEGNYSGYAFQYIPYIVNYLKYVLTDNENIINFMNDTFGLNKEQFRCIYQPVTEILSRNFDKTKETFDILWASRIDYEKLPDILEKIILQSDNKMRFHIFGKSVLNGGFKVEKLSRHKNTKYYGGFSNGLKNIPYKDYDMYLYTSAFDGMPNAVLEAIALGLPVVASDVGGIHEIIEDSKSGLLVEDFNDVEKYLDKIHTLMNNRNLLSKYSKNAQKKLQQNHNWAKYIDNLRNVFK